MHNQEAIKVYINLQLEITGQLDKLQSIMDKHNAEATQINWGHVGDMNHVLSSLKQLTEEKE